MVADIQVGDSIDFQYVEKLPFNPEFPREQGYKIGAYGGEVLRVRDTRIEPLRSETVWNHPNVERSQFLFVVRGEDRQIKSFYSGRMTGIVNYGPQGPQTELDLEPVVEKPRSFLKRILTFI